MFGSLKTRFGVLVAAALILGACGTASVANDPNISPEANAGKKFAAANCMGCHTVNGQDGQGPTWKGLSGKTVTLTDGSTVTADDAYLTAAIVDPDAQVVKGYHAGVMTAVWPKNAVKPQQAKDLVAYIDTLK